MGKKRRYITGLDGIRAIAVIMVLAYHLKLALFKSGFLGVTVFFVLSGYLITYILISEVEEEGTIDLKNFWLRRIRRLVPAVMSMAVVIIFVSAVVNRVIFTKEGADKILDYYRALKGAFLCIQKNKRILHYGYIIKQSL